MISGEQSLKNKLYSLKTNPLEGDFKCYCGFKITGAEITNAVLTGNTKVAVLKMVKRQNKYFPEYHIPCDCNKMGIDDNPTTDNGKLCAVILGRWEKDIDEEMHGDTHDYGSWHNDFQMMSNTSEEIIYRGYPYEILKSSEHFGIVYHVIRTRECISTFTDSSKTIFLIDEVSYNERNELGKQVDQKGNQI